MITLPAELDPVDDVEPAPSTAPVRRRTTVRQRLHRRFTAWRGGIVRVHRWSSFVVILFVVLESVTGAAIVFGGEIDRLWNRDAFSSSTGGDVGATTALAAARAARPDDLVSFLRVPSSDAGGVYWVYTTGATGDDHVVLVDPGSGEVTDDDHHLPSLVLLAERLHFNLNSTSILGMEPLTVMGWLGVVWLVSLLTGGYVWYWPGVKRWARAFRVRRRRGWFTFHLDLHKAVGLVVILPMTIVVITGINFAFPEEVESVWNAVTFGSYESPDTDAALSTRVRGAESISSQDAIEAVAALDPVVSVQSVDTPGGSPVGVFTVYAQVDGSFFGALGGERQVLFSVDQYTGGIVAIEDPADKNAASNAYDDWSYRLHFGTFGGTVTRWLWVALGLSPLVLAYTGTRMWFLRRSKRRKRAVSDSDPDPTPDSTLDATLEPTPMPGAT